MHRHSKLIPLAAVLAFAVGGAWAQTPPITSTPEAVGVSPKTAAEANQKAVQRSDTGTLVRTSPSAADKAKSAMDNTASGTATMSTTTGAPNASSNNTATVNTMPSARTTNTAPMRRARADRN